MLVRYVIELGLSNKVLTLILEHFSSFTLNFSLISETYLSISFHSFNTLPASLNCAEAPLDTEYPVSPL